MTGYAVTEAYTIRIDRRIVKGRYGSLADLRDKFSPMSALERIAVIQVPDFKGKISTS